MEPVIPLTVLSLAGLGLERHRLLKARSALTWRVHVNGTRGKSTTVRLLASMCRAYGLATVAKTTGGCPAYIDRAGHNRPWPRRGSARLSEQISFLAQAVKEGAEAAVLECMALDPYLQWASEHILIKATHTVITNVRPDHHEMMGATTEEIALSLGNAIPFRGELVLGDPLHADLLLKVAEARKTRVTVVSAVDRQLVEVQLGLGPDQKGFVECAAVAQATARRIGIPDETIWNVLRRWSTSAGAYSTVWQGRKVHVINGLAANDPVSAAYLWDLLPPREVPFCIYAHRSDRPLRLQAFLPMMVEKPHREILVVGAISPLHSLVRKYHPHLAAIGTRAAIGHLRQLLVDRSEAPWLLLLGNEMGLPRALHDLLRTAGEAG